MNLTVLMIEPIEFEACMIFLNLNMKKGIKMLECVSFDFRLKIGECTGEEDIVTKVDKGLT